MQYFILRIAEKVKSSVNGIGVVVVVVVVVVVAVVVVVIIIIIIIIVSEALFPLCRGTYISTLFGVCPTFRSRTTAIILFFLF